MGFFLDLVRDRRGWRNFHQIFFILISFFGFLTPVEEFIASKISYFPFQKFLYTPTESTNSCPQPRHTLRTSSLQAQNGSLASTGNKQ
jgi:hypothetical protein